MMLLGCSSSAREESVSSGRGKADSLHECPGDDQDSDGWDDWIEAAVGTAAGDPTDSPDGHGWVVFEMPFQEAPTPKESTLETQTRVARADVLILLDTTGSMGTTFRIRDHGSRLVSLLQGEVDDLAFGAAGYGDFPRYDGMDSHTDVPFYVVHRIMTVRTTEGIASFANSLDYRNINDGLGPWFSIMRGGDEPEQGWEALRQASTGVGISFPPATSYTTIHSVPPFSGDTAYPSPAPDGEEVGTLGGVGFREGALPIIVMITDTSNHDDPWPGTSPTAATREVALDALAGIHAVVVGQMAWKTAGREDLEDLANTTGGRVTPDVWGSGSDRPPNCPADRCCLIADDTSTSAPEEQPLPVDGSCTLVFQGDRYDASLSTILAQGIAAVVRGVPSQVGATITDAAGDEVDTIAAFVERLEAVESGACAGGIDSNGDGILDTFDRVVPGTEVCFRVTVHENETVAAQADPRAFRAKLQLTGNGLASLNATDVWFVVPPTGTDCDDPPVDDVAACAESCGEKSSVEDCYCDEDCQKYGDCCADACESCDLAACMPSLPQCVDHCGEASDAGSCYCDAECTSYGDCCTDACETCEVGC